MAWTTRERVLLVGCVLLALFGFFMTYTWLDMAVSLGYAHDEVEYRGRTIGMLRDLLQETSARWTRTDITAMVNQKFEKERVVKLEGGVFWVEEVGFRFEGEAVKKIEVLNFDE